MKRAYAVLFILLQLIGATHLGAAAPARKPNILLIVADDLGYGDLGSYGAIKFETPNIDRLAREGVLLTDAHSSSSVCQPSRYAILSGTYFMRAKRRYKEELYFHDGQVTLPALLKSAGYRTAAIGKWHLGLGRAPVTDYNAEIKPGPLEVGFDYFFGTPRTHNEPPLVFVENHRVFGLDPDDPIRMVSNADVVKRGLKDFGWGLSEGAQSAHAARPEDGIDLVFADKAVEVISQRSDQPLFLYLAFLAPHVPLAPSQEFLGSSDAGRYGDFIQELDACVGKVLEALRAHGMMENTLVIFTSDNGAVLHAEALRAEHRANGPLLGQKTDAWEGGHRVPFIARWPGRIPAGSQADQLLGLTDLMATLAAAAGVAVPPRAAPDSLNQLPVLLDPYRAPAVRTEFLVQGTGGYGLRQGEWLFIPGQGSFGWTVPAEPNPRFASLGQVTSDVDEQGRIRPNAPPVQLYNLATDLFQRWNLAVNYPQRVEALGKRLSEYTYKPAFPGPVTIRPGDVFTTRPGVQGQRR